jgi:hypothetical protein
MNVRLNLQDQRISPKIKEQAYSSTLKMEEVHSSEMWVNFCQITRCHVPEYCTLRITVKFSSRAYPTTRLSRISPSVKKMKEEPSLLMRNEINF